MALKIVKVCYFVEAEAWENARILHVKWYVY